MLPILWKAVHFEKPANDKFKLEKQTLLFVVQNCVLIRISLFSQLHAANNCAYASVSNSLALAKIKNTKSNLRELFLEARNAVNQNANFGAIGYLAFA